MTVEHTKTPWEVHEPYRIREAMEQNAWTDDRMFTPIWAADVDETNEPIALVNRADDAEHIQTAVNAHAALVAALRAIVFQVNQGKVLERDACITQARAALAKARKDV